MLEKMIDKLKIGPHLFDVLYLSKVVHSDGTELLGQCDRNFNKIEIESGLPLTKQAEVEIHELLHGMLSGSGMFPEDSDEELLVTDLAVRLVSFAQDNPDWLRRWIGRCARPDES